MDYFDMNRRVTSSDFDFPDDRNVYYTKRGRSGRGVGIITVIIVALICSMVGSGVTYLAMSSVNPTAEKTVDTTLLCHRTLI